MRKRWMTRAAGVFSALDLAGKGNLPLRTLDASDIAIIATQIAIVLWALIEEDRNA